MHRAVDILQKDEEADAGIAIALRVDGDRKAQGRLTRDVGRCAGRPQIFVGTAKVGGRYIESIRLRAQRGPLVGGP